MKRRITTLIVLLMSFVYANAQITLDASNVPHNTSYLEGRDYVFDNLPTIVEGPNQIYDFSSMPTPIGSLDTEYFPVTRPEFINNSTRFDLGFPELGPIELSAEYYTLKDQNGIYETGSYTIPQTSSLQPITGNANDFIEFPGNVTIFTTPSTILSFPHTFGTNITSSYTFITEFELTVASFNLSATPGENLQSAVQTTETVGYGQLILPMAGGQSIPYDVLLVKEVRTATNTINLAGAPAPDALLNAFGLTQGQSSNFAQYLFYTENYEAPILTVLLEDDLVTPDQLFYDIQILQLDNLSVDENEFSSSISLYPNPASNLINISFNATDASVEQIVIYDLSGRVMKNIAKNTLNNSSQIPVDIQDLANGTYLMKISSNNNTTTKKFMVKN